MSLKQYKSEDGQTLLLPSGMLGEVELPASAVRQIVGGKKERAPPTPAQLEARKRFGEMVKENARLLKEAKARQAEELKKGESIIKKEVYEFKADVKQRKIAKENEKVAAGTHIRVVVKPPSRRRKQETTTETETDTTDVTETETEDEDYKPKQRAIRRQAKKLVKTVEKIDKVIQQVPAVPSNPYASMLASRWR